MFGKIFKLSRLWKKILGVVFILGASSFLFNGSVGMVSEAHAQEDQTNTQTQNSSLVDKTEVVGIVDLTLKVVYILLRPLLVIAGLSLDNTLVYGSFLHMDAPLRAFRNIMKNFANFALGFLVLFAIIRKIFSFGKAGDKWEPQKIITQTLIAGVLIQISRFVMAALVDLSTVATYAIGALPLNVVSSTPLGQHKVMNAHVNLDLSKFQKVVDGNEYFKVRYSVPNPNGGPELNFSECKTKNGYVVGRMDGGTGFRNEQAGWGGTKNACVKGGQLVFFNEFPSTYSVDNNAEYQSRLQKLYEGVLYPEDVWEPCDFIVKINGKKNTTISCGDGFAPIAQSFVGDPDEEIWSWMGTYLPATAAQGEYGSVYGQTWLDENPAALTLDKIVDKSKGFVGPLITMYSSMLDFSQLANTTNDTSFGEIGGEMLIKVGFAIGLFFPLIALAIVLIIRIGFMRAVIVLSPFLVLINAFGFAEKLGESLKKHFNITNVIKVIFAPVITVFALSISLVFMSTLMASIKTGGMTGFGITKLATSEAGTQMFSFFKDCLQLKLDGFDFGGALDVFSWFLMNMVGIGLMRGIVFAAIKSNSIGEKIGGQVQTFGANFFQTLPILPVPGGEPVGLGSFGKVLGEVPEKYVNLRETEQRGRVEKRVGLEGEGGGTTTTLKEKEVTNIVNAIGTGTVTAEAATAKALNIEEGVTKEVIQSNLPVLFEAVTKAEPGKKEAAIKALETSVGDVNAYEKYTLDTSITDGMTLSEAETNVGTLSIPEPANRQAFIDAKITKKLKNVQGAEEDYIIGIDATNNKYIFTKKETTPVGNK